LSFDDKFGHAYFCILMTIIIIIIAGGLCIPASS